MGQRTVGGVIRSAWYRRFHVASLLAFHERKSAALTRTRSLPDASSSPSPTFNTSESTNAIVSALLPLLSHTCREREGNNDDVGSGGWGGERRLPPLPAFVCTALGM